MGECSPITVENIFNNAIKCTKIYLLFLEKNLLSEPNNCELDLGARARASGSEREMGRATASEIFPVSERQYI